MGLTELCCKSCGAPLAADNVVERLAMARCGHCGAVFALDRPATAAGPSADLPRERPKVPLPRGIQVQELGSTLEITRRWFSPVFLFLAFFCVMWNGFMLVWHGMALASGAWFMSLFGLLHTAVGVWLLYYTLAGFLNTTTIRVQWDELEVRHGPVPWPGNKTLSARDLEQFYCQEKINRGKNGVQYAYQVLALRKDHVRETLLTGLSDVDQALYIEQELERFLRIEDRPMPGEVGR